MCYGTSLLSSIPYAARVQSSAAVQQLGKYVVEGAKIWPIQGRNLSMVKQSCLTSDAQTAYSICTFLMHFGFMAKLFRAALVKRGGLVSVVFTPVSNCLDVPGSAPHQDKSPSLTVLKRGCISNVLVQRV